MQKYIDKADGLSPPRNDYAGEVFTVDRFVTLLKQEQE